MPAVAVVGLEIAVHEIPEGAQLYRGRTWEGLGMALAGIVVDAFGVDGTLCRSRLDVKETHCHGCHSCCLGFYLALGSQMPGAESWIVGHAFHGEASYDISGAHQDCGYLYLQTLPHYLEGHCQRRVPNSLPQGVA